LPPSGYSPVSLPLHGGEIRSLAPPPPFGVLPRFATAPRGRDPFAPRPLPPSGYSPVSLPLHGGELRSLAPLRGSPPVSLPLHGGEIRSLAPLRGVVPPFRYRSTGERFVRSSLFRGPSSAA